MVAVYRAGLTRTDAATIAIKPTVTPAIIFQLPRRMAMASDNKRSSDGRTVAVGCDREGVGKPRSLAGSLFIVEKCPDTQSNSKIDGAHRPCSVTRLLDALAERVPRTTLEF